MPVCAVPWVVGFFALLCVPAMAQAQDRFEVPIHCGSARELDEAWTKLVSPRIDRERPSVELASSTEGFRLSVATAEGPRVLLDTDCRVLFRTAVLIVALAMVDDADRKALAATTSLGEPPPEPVEAPTSAPPREAPADPPRARVNAVESKASAREKPPWSLIAELAAGVVVGLVPDVNAGFSAGLGTQRGRWGLKAVASYVLPRQRQNETRQGVRVDAASASLLATFDPGPVWALALGLEGVAVRGQGSPNLVDQTSDFLWLWGPRAEAHVRPWRGRRVDLDIGLAGSYFPDNARFQFNDGTLVYATSHVTGEASLGLHWRIR